MSIDRIQQLEQFFQEDPGDPFNLYALALEYLKTDRHKSRQLFEVLLRQHSGYLPTYYHAARCYYEVGQKDEAVSILERGIALAQKLNDLKTLRELRSAHDEMTFE